MRLRAERHRNTPGLSLGKKSLFSSVLTLVTLTLILSSCGKKEDPDSKITIRFPDGKSQSSNSNQKVSAMNFDFSLACYAVNVTADTITQTLPKTCEIPIGVFAGFIPAGGQVSVIVPNGYKRKLEVFAYQRSSATEACATSSGGFGTVNKSRIARVGEVLSFDTVQPVVDLAVKVLAPSTGVNLLTQYSLPNTCAVAFTPKGSGSSGLTLGQSTLTSASYKVFGSVSAQTNQKVLTSSSFRLELSRSE